MRLNKFLSSTGIAARRKCDTLIFSGKVRVNGKIVYNPGIKVDDNDVITVNEKVVKAKKKFDYIVLNKPRGYITTMSDEKGRKKVIDLIDTDKKVYPVGRLDTNSMGVLLFTNDGDLTYRLLHPGYGVWKIYRVKLHRPFKDTDINILKKGIKLKTGDAVSGNVKIVSPDKKEIEIKIKEGKKHLIKLMMEKLGYFVKSLDRIKFGNIEKTGLARGQWRFLKKSEIIQLKKLVKL
ncbi:rRNA pseudouridine synthase [candidate division KSB1 bacterium]|nr:MAG: rRNA pseudouridine synthase [candidate division KSB1 bacterium]